MTEGVTGTRSRGLRLRRVIATASFFALVSATACASSTKSTVTAPTSAKPNITVSTRAPGPQVVRVTLVANGIERKNQPGPISHFTMLPLGAGTERETIVTEKSGVNSDTAVLTFADGSTLHERYQWTLVKGTGPNPPNPGSKNWFTATDVITGGTGRFTGASGTLRGTGTTVISAFDAATNMVTKDTAGSLKGDVTIPHPS